MASAHTSTGDGILTWVASNWWLLLIFGGGILEWAGETFNVGVNALRRRAKAKRKHQLELKRLELKIAQAKAEPSPIPGPCRHRKAVPVRNNDGDVLAWLCRACDTQLPPEFSVYTEDL